MGRVYYRGQFSIGRVGSSQRVFFQADPKKRMSTSGIRSVKKDGTLSEECFPIDGQKQIRIGRSVIAVFTFTRTLLTFLPTPSHPRTPCLTRTHPQRQRLQHSCQAGHCLSQPWRDKPGREWSVPD